MLKISTRLVEVTTTTDEVVGYFWFTYVITAEGHDPIVEMHLCCAPEWKGRWLSRRVIREAFVALKDTGARYCLAIMPDAQLRSVLERLGWKSKGASVHMLDLQDTEMSFLSGLFGGVNEEKFVADPIEPPEDQRTDIDPNLSDELSAAKRQREDIVAMRGRSALVSSRKTTTNSGVNIVS